MTGAYHLFTAIISVRHIASLVNAYKIHTHFFTGHISSSGIGRRLALIAASRRDISATGKKSLRLITAIRRLASRAVATSSSQSAIEVFVVASVAVGHSLRNIIAERRSGSPVAGASQKIIGSLRRIASRVVGFFSGNKYGRAPILLTVTMPTIIIGSVIMPTMIARNVTMPVEIDLSLIIP
jgi:hypothetical protein